MAVILGFQLNQLIQKSVLCRLLAYLSIYRKVSCLCVSSDVMKLVVMFVMTMTSLKVFKTFVHGKMFNCKMTEEPFVHGKMFNCKMTEEPTMATAEEAAQRVYAKKLAADRESKKRKRSEEEELPEKRETRLAAKRESEKRRRAEELPVQRETRLAAKRESEKRRRAEESQEQQENMLAADRESKKRKRAEESQEQPENYRLAFRYSPVDDYSLSRCVQIRTMSKIYPYCKALKFNGETMGMCCTSGKVKLPLLAAPPEPLKTLLTGTTSESKRF